jgi:hypothetical protein
MDPLRQTVPKQAKINVKHPYILSQFTES